MNNLSKALSLVELVFAQDGKPVTPSQAAAGTGINLATCARIMTELVEAGYLDKVSRRSGYVGGPLVFALAGRPGNYHAIVEASREPLLELAAELGHTINLAVMERGLRRILLSAPPPGGDQVPLRGAYEGFEDFHGSATGRLLLSRLTAAERGALAARLGLTPAEREVLADDLAKLGGAKEALFLHSDMNLWIVGALLEPPELPVFAFGFGVPESKKEAGVAACRRTAERISIKFQHQELMAF